MLSLWVARFDHAMRLGDWSPLVSELASRRSTRVDNLVCHLGGAWGGGIHLRVQRRRFCFVCRLSRGGVAEDMTRALVPIVGLLLHSS